MLDSLVRVSRRVCQCTSNEEAMACNTPLLCQTNFDVHACMHACIYTYTHTYIHAYIHKVLVVVVRGRGRGRGLGLGLGRRRGLGPMRTMHMHMRLQMHARARAGMDALFADLAAQPRRSLRGTQIKATTCLAKPTPEHSCQPDSAKTPEALGLWVARPSCELPGDFISGIAVASAARRAASAARRAACRSFALHPPWACRLQVGRREDHGDATEVDPLARQAAQISFVDLAKVFELRPSQGDGPILWQMRQDKLHISNECRMGPHPHPHEVELRNPQNRETICASDPILPENPISEPQGLAPPSPNHSERDPA